MKKLPVIIVIFSLFLQGCSIFKDPYANKNKIASAQANVQSAKDDLNSNNKDKVIQIQSTAAGVDYALTKVTNPPTAVSVAKELNDRTVSIAGVPNVKEMEKMKKMVDNLTSAVDDERKKGLKALQEKDKEITKIQQQNEILNQELLQKQEEFEKASQKVAETADKYKQTVDEVNSYFGLGGVIYGIKKFVMSSFIFILSFGLIFLILRLLASTNPIAGAIFSLFDMAAGTVLKIFKGLFPGSIKSAKFVEQEHFDAYKETLIKIVDTIEEFKSHQSASEAKYTLDEILTSFSKNLNDDQKKLISDIKKEIRWSP